MRHRRHGRVLGRSPSHRRALLRNLTSALILTERPDSEFDVNPPKVKGRIITTVAKAKEVRPMVEKCITIAKRGLAAQREAAQFGTQADRNTEQWKQWRTGPNYSKWVQANAPAVTARRRLYQMLVNKEAVAILMNELAERFEDRQGGYTRILRLATPRLGDAGPRAMLEFVGRNDRVVKRSEKPDFGGGDQSEKVQAEEASAEPDVNTPTAVQDQSADQNNKSAAE
jgi:large subunit ribosomal protein L17